MTAHGDALANHGAHASALHATNAMAGKHPAAEHEHATSKVVGTDHHHHPHRREPQYGGAFWGYGEYGAVCDRVPDPFNPWYNCYGPTKKLKGHT